MFKNIERPPPNFSHPVLFGFLSLVTLLELYRTEINNDSTTAFIIQPWGSSSRPV